jgi:hypothetical protein
MSEDVGDAASLRVECSSSDGDDEDRGIDVYRLRFNSNRNDELIDYPTSSSSIHTAQQTPSTSSAGSVNVNASIKVSYFFASTANLWLSYKVLVGKDCRTTVANVSCTVV